MLSEFSERGCQGCDPHGTLMPFITRAEAWRHRWGPPRPPCCPTICWAGEEEAT